MKKRVVLTIAGLLVLAAALAAIKGLQIGAMIKQGKKFVPPPETVTSFTVKADDWETDLTSVGSLSAVQGVTVTAELQGKVTGISFEPGATVKKGDILLRQDTSFEEAQLPGLIAQANLARTNLVRSEELLAKGIISKADLDNAAANTAQAMAQAESLRAVIAKKTIRAPFGGYIGIRQVNLGQFLREGDAIVTLQALDPIFVDFTLPQQQLRLVKTGLSVRITSDSLPGTSVMGRVTAINPQVDAESRNVRVQATLSNQSGILRPGMFVNVSIVLPARHKVLAIPATAVVYAPYSDSVFVIDEGKSAKVLRQQFIRLGDKLGDLVAVTEGLNGDETIVSTGVFKLRNGQAVVIDNKLAPEFKKSPRPENN